jgi:hypothetical protein
VTKYVSSALEPAIFQLEPAHYAFDAAPYNGICQACHTDTDYHTNDGSADNSHEIGSDCMACHGHSGGFAATGGCKICHDTARDAGDGGPVRRAVTGEFGLTSHHVMGGDVTDEDCAVCHYEAVDGAYHKDNMVDLRDPDDGTPSTLISFAQFSRNTSSDTLESWVTDVQNNFCMKCHDSDGATATNISGNPLRPFSVSIGDVPDVYSRFDTANSYHHAVRGAGNNPYAVPGSANGYMITMEPPWNQDASHDMISCFDCHGVSGHGGGNQRMLRSAIDFDTMLSVTSKTQLPGGMGADVEGFCTTCHKASVYVSAGDPESVGSVFEFHGQGQRQHAAAGGNDLGCLGCHAGIVPLFGMAPISDNGSAPGNIHGGSFTWPPGNFAAGTDTERFILGGFIGGWAETSPGVGKCSGGECGHVAGRTYTR